MNAPDPNPHSDADSKAPDENGLPGLAAFAVLGTTIATCIALGVGLGIWADKTWHTSPVGLLIGIVLGTVAAVVSVVQQVRRYL